ncbi:hypothetical protein BR93DRAFT_975433 [Coniochaeta sp. PMI_546]|nr:hypothetical protein BR93DRAFT_975433 [Coniochaeta sp. PMI_546]
MSVPVALQSPRGAIHARQACVSCRGQKRKCSRQLPRCDLCQKKKQRCEYLPEALPDADEDPAAIAEPQALAENRFPALFFLDTWLFCDRRLAVPAAEANLPRHIETMFAHETQEALEALLDRYFTLVHPSFPVLSKLKMRRYLDSPRTLSNQPDMVFLIMAVRLLCLNIAPSQSADDPGLLYRQSKECYAALEMQGVITPLLLQGALLLSYWEMGQAVYPAAFLSVGLCARLAEALGNHKQRDRMPMYPDTGSAVDAEEQRRVWWGILTIDRYVVAGMTGRPFSFTDARPEDLLPMLEGSWDIGEPSVTPSLAACSDVSRPVSAFARTCQASHLLSRVLRHINEPPADMSLWYQDGIRLHHVLEAFSSGVVLDLQQPNITAESRAYPAVGLVYTAQILLYDSHTCAEFDQPGGVGLQEQLEMQALSLAGLRNVCPAVSRFATGVRAALRAGDAMASSPLLLNSLYEAGKYYLWYYRETHRAELLTETNEIMLTLRALTSQWALAGQYIAILDGDEFRPSEQV